MKKIQTKRLVLRTNTLAELSRTHGGEDPTSFQFDICFTYNLTKTLDSILINCPPPPSDANGDCRTYTPSHLGC